MFSHREKKNNSSSRSQHCPDKKLIRRPWCEWCNIGLSNSVPALCCWFVPRERYLNITWAVCCDTCR